MTKKCFVFSTMATDISYVKYSDAPAGGLPRILRSVTIKGGAGVASKKLVTLDGIVTEVSADDLEFLRADAQFIRHEKAGFHYVSDTRHDLDPVVGDMNRKDNSRPLTAADFEAGGRAARRTADGSGLMKPPTIAATA